MGSQERSRFVSLLLKLCFVPKMVLMASFWRPLSAAGWKRPHFEKANSFVTLPFDFFFFHTKNEN